MENQPHSRNSGSQATSSAWMFRRLESSGVSVLPPPNPRDKVGPPRPAAPPPPSPGAAPDAQDRRSKYF